MNLKEVASIAGKGGLFKIVKPTRSGVIVETLDEKQNRMAVSANSRISVLQEISIYTTTADGSVPLGQIFSTMKKEFEDDLGVNGNSPSDELRAFMKHVLPDYDEERVYISDIKKLISWYNILYKFAPEALVESGEEESTETTDGEEKAEEEPTTEAKAKEVATKEEKPKEKPAAKKKKKETEGTAEPAPTKKSGQKKANKKDETKGE